MMGLAMFSLLAGYVLVYCGIRAYDPRCVVVRAFKSGAACERIDAEPASAPEPDRPAPDEHLPAWGQPAAKRAPRRAMTR